MTRFRTPYNFDASDECLYETPVGESMTEPDQSYSVKEILERFTSGTLSREEIEHTSDYFNDDIDNPDPHILDLTDIDDIARQGMDARKKIEEAIAASKDSNDAQP